MDKKHFKTKLSGEISPNLVTLKETYNFMADLLFYRLDSTELLNLSLV